MGISFGGWLVPVHVTQTLPHTYLSHQAHQERTTIRHSPIPTQAHHQSYHHPRRQSDARIGRLRQSNTRHDKQRQKLSGSPRSPPNHRGNKSPRTSTTRLPHRRHNIFHYPQNTTSSRGANTQHVTSSEGAGASKCAHNHRY